MLPEKNILRNADGQVTFRYTNNTGTHNTRTLAGADFLWLLLRHVLPKGFRRSRDYGFLHANCKQLIGGPSGHPLLFKVEMGSFGNLDLFEHSRRQTRGDKIREKARK